MRSYGPQKKNKGVQNTDTYHRRRKEEQQIKEIFWKWFFTESVFTIVEFVLCLACLILALVCKYRWPDIVLASVFLTITQVDLVSWFVIRPITYHCWIMVSTAGFLSFCLYTGHLLFQFYPTTWIIGIVLGCLTAIAFLVDLVLLLIRFKRFPNPYWMIMYYSEMVEATTCTYGEKLPEDDLPVCYCGENGGDKCRCGRPPTPDLCTCCECGTEFEVAKQTCFNLGTQVDMPRPLIKFTAEAGKHPDPYEPEGRELSPSVGVSKTSVDPRESVPDEPARKWRRALKDHELASVHSMRDAVTFRRTPCPLPGATNYYDDDDFFAKKSSSTRKSEPDRKSQATASLIGTGPTKRSFTQGAGGGGCTCAAPVASIFDRSNTKAGSSPQEGCPSICPGTGGARSSSQAQQQSQPQTIQYFCDEGPPSKRTATGSNFVSSTSRPSRTGNNKSPTRTSSEMAQPRKTSKGDLKKGLPAQMSHLTNIQDHLTEARYLMLTNSIDNVENPRSSTMVDSPGRRSRSVQPRGCCATDSRRSQSAAYTDTNTRLAPRNVGVVIKRPSISSDMQSPRGMVVRNAATVVRPGTGHGYSPRSSQNYIVQSPRCSIDSPRNRYGSDYSPRSSQDGQPPSSPVYIRR